MYLERALFILGEQNTGKSKQLRSIFRDVRFGTNGEIPDKGRVDTSYPLSTNRRLYIRLTSPHEGRESLEDFIGKIQAEANKHSSATRWNVIAPMQFSSGDYIDGAITAVQQFSDEMHPDRVRCVILNPTCHNHFLKNDVLDTYLSELSYINKGEIIVVDARTIDGNGLIYADFFDFS